MTREDDTGEREMKKGKGEMARQPKSVDTSLVYNICTTPHGIIRLYKCFLLFLLLSLCDRDRQSVRLDNAH